MPPDRKNGKTHSFGSVLGTCLYSFGRVLETFYTVLEVFWGLLYRVFSIISMNLLLVFPFFRSGGVLSFEMFLGGFGEISAIPVSLRGNEL